MLISGKGKYFSVFGCISKNFPKNIFWCLEKKKENTNPENHNPKNHQRRQAIAIDGAIAIRDRDRVAFSARSRSTARSRDPRSRSRIFLTRRRSQRRDCDQRRDLAVRRFSSRVRVLSLSLSFFGNALKGKQKCKLISVVKGIFFGSTDFNFWKIEFPNQPNSLISGKAFPEVIFTQNKHSLSGVRSSKVQVFSTSPTGPCACKLLLQLHENGLSSH